VIVRVHYVQQHQPTITKTYRTEANVCWLFYSVCNVTFVAGTVVPGSSMYRSATGHCVLERGNQCHVQVRLHCLYYFWFMMTCNNSGQVVHTQA